MEQILESHGVKIQLYHSLTLTGVATIALLNKYKAIMDEVAPVAIDEINKRSQDTQPIRPPATFIIILDLH